MWFVVTNSDIDAIHARHDVIACFVRPETHPFVNEFSSKLETLTDVRHLLVRWQNGTMGKSQWQRLQRGLIQASLGGRSEQLRKPGVEIDSILDLKSPKKRESCAGRI
jgi:hypothetical protein